MNFAILFSLAALLNLISGFGWLYALFGVRVMDGILPTAVIWLLAVLPFLFAFVFWRLSIRFKNRDGAVG